jgi:hypothetical protein
MASPGGSERNSSSVAKAGTLHCAATESQGVSAAARHKYLLGAENSQSTDEGGSLLSRSGHPGGHSARNGFLVEVPVPRHGSLQKSLSPAIAREQCSRYYRQNLLDMTHSWLIDFPSLSAAAFLEIVGRSRTPDEDWIHYVGSDRGSSERFVGGLL